MEGQNNSTKVKILRLAVWTFCAVSLRKYQIETSRVPHEKEAIQTSNLKLIVAHTLYRTLKNVVMVNLHISYSFYLNASTTPIRCDQSSPQLQPLPVTPPKGNPDHRIGRE
jgi:hypothetical protein